MRVQPWSPDPDKYVEDCETCNESGIVFSETGTAFAMNPSNPDEFEPCPDCGGTGIVVDWETVEAALLGSAGGRA